MYFKFYFKGSIYYARCIFIYICRNILFRIVISDIYKNEQKP